MLLDKHALLLNVIILTLTHQIVNILRIRSEDFVAYLNGVSHLQNTLAKAIPRR